MTPADQSVTKLFDQQLLNVLNQRAPTVTKDAAKGWLGACGTIVGITTGAVLFAGPGADEYISSPVIRWGYTGLSFVGVVFLIMAVWRAADAAFALKKQTAGQIAGRGLTIEDVDRATAGARYQRIRTSRAWLASGVLLLMLSAVISWNAEPDGSVKLTVCSDLSINSDTAVVVERPEVNLPDDLSLDEIDEITYKECPES